MACKLPLGCLVIFLALLPVAAPAQDLANGEHIARTRCAACHVIDGDYPRARRSAAPAFSAIAQWHKTTTGSLDAFLGKPHAGMPDFYLTYDETRDVSAFIISLRK